VPGDAFTTLDIRKLALKRLHEAADWDEDAFLCAPLGAVKPGGGSGRVRPERLAVFAGGLGGLQIAHPVDSFGVVNYRIWRAWWCLTNPHLARLVAGEVSGGIRCLNLHSTLELAYTRFSVRALRLR
jgi:hypothetical protein